ncbi:MAG: hypothetical protein IT365_27270 [Candidatus Hydrogenedentes bacterium]|nr:hypothetical protein [Candidatus Hydrogenedentota bacterium]
MRMTLLIAALVAALHVSATAEVASMPVGEMTFTSGNGSLILRLHGEDWLRFTTPLLAGQMPEANILDAGQGWACVGMEWNPAETVQQDELSIPFDIVIEPDFWWAPHLTPEEGFCIAQHVFRSPALIAARGHDILVIVPDLNSTGEADQNPWFMDLDAPARKLWLGMTRTSVPLHVLYKKEPGMTFAPGPVQLGFYVTIYRDEGDPVNPWGRVSQWLWEKWGSPLHAKGEPLRVPMDTFVRHTYTWAFDTWKDALWQEFSINGEKLGAPAFIVNVSQSPNYPGVWYQREFLSVWNQAWFSTLRVGAGMRRFATRTNDPALMERAEMIKRFTLAAPQRNGLFPSVYRTANKEVVVDGEKVLRPEPWDTAFWTNSNRVPWKSEVTDKWFHTLDASWTCLLLLRWYEEFEKDERLLAYVKNYADRLVTLQGASGFFPAWLHPETDAPWDQFRQSPETSMSVTFLLKLAAITGEDSYRDPALRAMDAVIRECAATGRWEDFETYFSCCTWGYPEYLGKRIERNAMYKQCNFSMFWTAEALLECYRATKDSRYLRWGRRTLDELSMTQQVWQPPFIQIPALGGFGVMNCDGEWNDSRECLFAELFMEYYRETGERHLFERGIAALKSAFVMMYCPENPTQKALYEKVHPFFGPEDYGFTMENYGHGGTASSEGEGIGPFTIFTWGNGAAAEARNRVRDHWGDVYVDRQRGMAFGIDSIDAALDNGKLTLTSLSAASRDVRIQYENGYSQDVVLDRTVTLDVPDN